MSRADVKLLILTTGEHILGKALSGATCDECQEIEIENPVSIVPHPDPSQQGKLVFMPYLQLSEDKSCFFRKDHVRHVLTPKQAMVNDWDRQFGSGLLIPQQNIILE